MKQILKSMFVLSAMFIVFGLAAVWSMAWFLGGSQLHQEEIERLASPSGQIEAVMIEADAGATTANSCWVHVLPRGEKKMGLPAVVLSGVLCNEQEYGVHLDWAAPDILRIKYSTAQKAMIHMQAVTIGSETIQIQLQPTSSRPAEVISKCGSSSIDIQFKSVKGLNVGADG